MDFRAHWRADLTYMGIWNREWKAWRRAWKTPETPPYRQFAANKAICAD
jgi:hypothetical protein